MNDKQYLLKQIDDLGNAMMTHHSKAQLGDCGRVELLLNSMIHVATLHDIRRYVDRNISDDPVQITLDK